MKMLETAFCHVCNQVRTHVVVMRETSPYILVCMICVGKAADTLRTETAANLDRAVKRLDEATVLHNGHANVAKQARDIRDMFDKSEVAHGIDKEFQKG